MPKRGKRGALPQRGRRLTTAESAAIKAEEPDPDGLFHLDAIAVGHSVDIRTAKAHLKPPKDKLIPRTGSRIPPEANALVLKLLNDSGLSYGQIVARVRDETDVRISLGTVRNRATERTKRLQPKRKKTRHFKTAAAQKKALDSFCHRVNGIASKRFNRNRALFTEAAMTEEGLGQELRRRLQDRLDYYHPDNGLLESFIRRETTNIMSDIRARSRRRVEKNRRLQRETQAKTKQGDLNERPLEAPTPFALLGLHIIQILQECQSPLREQLWGQWSGN